MQQENKNKRSRKIRKSVWLPLALLAYFGIMAWGFGRDHINTGHTLRLVITSGIELLIVIVLFFLLRKKEKSEERRQTIKDRTQQIK